MKVYVICRNHMDELSRGTRSSYFGAVPRDPEDHGRAFAGDMKLRMLRIMKKI